MPATQHAQPPDDPAEPPRRRDHESPAAGDNAQSCGCGGCREFRAIHTGFCGEPPLRDRLVKRETDRAALRRWEHATVFSGGSLHARAV